MIGNRSRGYTNKISAEQRNRSRRHGYAGFGEGPTGPAEVENRWLEFEQVLFGDKRKYPVREFKAFWEAAKRYAELTKSDPLIHRSVVGAVHVLTDIIGHGRKRIPDQVAWDAQRLESLVFRGYDPHFEGDEPPGL